MLTAGPYPGQHRTAPRGSLGLWPLWWGREPGWTASGSRVAGAPREAPGVPLGIRQRRASQPLEPRSWWMDSILQAARACAGIQLEALPVHSAEPVAPSGWTVQWHSCLMRVPRHTMVSEMDTCLSLSCPQELCDLRLLSHPAPTHLSHCISPAKPNVCP